MASRTLSSSEQQPIVVDEFTGRTAHLVGSRAERVIALQRRGGEEKKNTLAMGQPAAML